jgi:hypothetical protein
MLFSESSINTRTDKNVCATEAGFFCTVINSNWYNPSPTTQKAAGTRVHAAFY